MHINRDFEVVLYKAMEVFVSARTRRADFGQFKEILVYQSQESSVVQSVVGQSLRLVMTRWVRHLATSLLKSSNDK
jgi:hypothetical protein